MSENNFTPDQVKAGYQTELFRETRQQWLRTRKPRKYKLEELLEGITEDNRHDAVDFGDPVGNEIID